MSFGRAVCALYWVHPLAWMALHRLRVEAEMACDDLVISADTRGSTYAGELLEMVSTLGIVRCPLPAVAMAQRRNG